MPKYRAFVVYDMKVEATIVFEVDEETDPEIHAYVLAEEKKNTVRVIIEDGTFENQKDGFNPATGPWIEKVEIDNA
jgi:hypothetical protein